MPEFTTRLKTEEIADLVAYAMSLRGASPAAAPSRRRARRRPKRRPAARCSSTPPEWAPAGHATNLTGGASRWVPILRRRRANGWRISVASQRVA